MKKKNYIVLFIIIFLIPIIIWLAYFVGTINGGISTSFLAGDLLAYTGSVFTSVVTIYAVIITINNNKDEIKKQNHLLIQRSHDDKLYDEVCQMARDIMVYLSLHELLSTLHPIIKSREKNNIELVDKALIAIDNSRKNLVTLHKKQWYYHERLKNEGFFIDDSDDSINVKTYFIFIYNLLNSLSDKLMYGSTIQRFNEYEAFFEEIDKFSNENQYKITEKTTALIKGIKNIFVSNLDKYDA